MWNCKHTIFPVILGVSAQALDSDTLKQYRDLSTEQMTIDGKTMSRYEWSQEQRRVETAVRMQKDVATLAKASGDMKAVRAAQANIDKLMEYYDKISEESGVKQEYGRMAGSTRISRGAKVTSKANKGVPELTFGATGNIITPEEAEQKLREYIKTDSVNKTVNPEKQSRHIKDSAGYIAGRSYILGGIEAAQELVNKYHGTGIPQLSRKGSWNNKEFVAVDYIIGIDIDEHTKAEKPVNQFYIHYSSTGVHIVPTKTRKKR